MSNQDIGGPWSEEWTNRATATLEKDGRRYVVRAWYPSSHEDHTIRFHWEDGNYACDDNRSYFIMNQCDPDFPEHDCGRSIVLVDLTIERGLSRPPGEW